MKFYKKLQKYSYKLDSSEGMVYLNIANEKYLVNAIGSDRNYALESFNGDYFVKE